MVQNFIGCDRDQSFLLPPDVRDWLPDGHLAWFNRTITRFHRRGRLAVQTEWRLLMATHNLTKLHRHQLAAATA